MRPTLSFATPINDWPNLVVLRTLSKAWAAAGIRCGTVIADPKVIGLLQRVIAPYPLATTAIDAALKATEGEAINRQQNFIASVKKGRADLHEFLSSCEWVDALWQSEANFILLRVSNAGELVEWCATNGIRIRNFSSQPQLDGCVRLTIGSEEELSKLKTILRAYGERP